eukprot:gene8506-330_t
MSDSDDELLSPSTDFEEIQSLFKLFEKKKLTSSMTFEDTIEVRRYFDVCLDLKNYFYYTFKRPAKSDDIVKIKQQRTNRCMDYFGKKYFSKGISLDKIEYEELKKPQFHFEAIKISVKEIKIYLENSKLTPIQERKRIDFNFGSSSNDIFNDFDKKKNTNIKSELCDRELKYGHCRYTNILFSKIPTCTKRHMEIMSFKSKKSKLSNSHAMYYQIEQQFKKDFPNSTIKNIYEIKNEKAESRYNEIEKSFFAKNKLNVRKLYHGTSEKFLQGIYDSGFILPSDFVHNSNCKRNSNAPAYSLCDNTCPDCAGINKKKHVWNQCHMYGLGLYFADIPQKSDLYVSDSYFKKKNKKGRKLILCKVALGKTFTIDQDILNQDDYHDLVEPPSGYDR